MAISGSVTVGTPLIPLQKTLDMGMMKNKIVSHFRGKEHCGRAKVKEHETSGNLIARSKGTKGGLNLTAMFRASPKPSKVPSNGGQSTAPKTTTTTGPQTVTTTPQTVTTTAPKKPEPTPDERLATVREGIKELKSDLTSTLTAYEKARGKDASTLKGAKAEVNFMAKRDAMQVKIGEQLTSIDAALKASPSEDTRKALVAERRELIKLSVAAEFPKSVSVALQPFSRQLPEGALRSMTDGGKGITELDRDARNFINSFHRKPDGSPSPFVRDGGVPGRLDGVIRHMEMLDGEVGLDTDEKATLSYLKDLRQAVDLIETLDSTVTTLDGLRERFKGDKDLAKVSMGRLCREVSHFAPTMQKYGASDVPRHHATVLGTVDAIVSEMARNVVPDVFVTEDEGVKKMLSTLRREHCENLAATKFLNTLDLGGTPELAKALQNAKTEGKPLTVAEIKKHLPSEHAKGLDEAVKNGKTAAENREAYFTQLGRVSRALGDETGSGALTTYKAGIWLKVGGGGQDDLEGARAIGILKELGRKNPEAAFQVAALAVLEHRLAMSDREFLGLPWTDTVGIANFDPQRVLDFAGITTQQMVKLGYSAEDAASFPERLLRLSKNFDNVAELKDHLQFFTRTARDVMTNIGVQDAIGGFANDSGSIVAKRMLGDVYSDVSALSRGETRSTLIPNLDSQSHSVVEGFTQVSNSLAKVVITDDALAEKMELGNTTFQALDDKLVSEMRSRGDLEGRVRDARALLQASSGPGSLEGLDLNPDKPAGLRSAKAILEAIKWDNEVMILTQIGAPQEVINDAIAARESALKDLRGFDAETMRRPWTAKVAKFFGKDQRPDIGQLRSLRAVAENIVFLREGAITEKVEIDSRIALTAQLRADLAQARMAENPAVMGTAQQMIRAAILSHWPSSNATNVMREGHVVDAYEPSAHRDKIVATLKSWGFDVDAFAPELSMELNGTLSPDDLKRWGNEARPIDRDTGLIKLPVEQSRMASFKAALKSGVAKLTTVDGWKQVGIDTALYLGNKARMDENFKSDIFALTTTLKDGEKYDFKSGVKFSATTGKIPLDPTATLGIRGKMAVTGLSNFIIERSGENIKLTARSGAQAQLGVDLMADQRASFDDRLSAGVSVGGDVTGTYLGGKVESFPNTEVGRKALSAFLLAVVNGEKPGAESFEHLTESAKQREIGGKLGVNAKAYARAEFTTQPWGNDGGFFSSGPDDKSSKSGAGNKVGIGFVGGAEVAASLGGKVKTTRGLNKVAYESEFEVSTGISANISAYAKVPTYWGTMIGGIMTGSGAQQGVDDRFHSTKTGSDGSTTTSGQMDVSSTTANEQLLGMDIGASLTRTRKAKQEYSISSGPGAQERLTKAEVVSRSNLKLGPELSLLGIGSAELADRLATDPQFLKDYEALKAFMGPNDHLQITYAMKAGKLAQANDLMLEADDHEKNGNNFVAKTIRAKVSAMFLDETNFEPTKITVFSKTVLKDVANRGNAMLARLDIVAESTHEDAHVVLTVPPKKVG